MAVLWLDEAKEHLNIKTDDQDSELAATIDAAEGVIAQRVGPLESATVTCTVYSAGPSLFLPVAPVLSLTSVTSSYDGTVADLSGLVLNTSAGIVTSTTYGSGFTATGGAYTVVYEAGRDEVPADLLYAIKEMVRHLWRSQRGPASLPGQGGADAATPGYLIPNAVAELLEPHRQLSVA